MLLGGLPAGRALEATGSGLRGRVGGGTQTPHEEAGLQLGAAAPILRSRTPHTLLAGNGSLT